MKKLIVMLSVALAVAGASRAEEAAPCACEACACADKVAADLAAANQRIAALELELEKYRAAEAEREARRDRLRQQARERKSEREEVKAAREAAKRGETLTGIQLVRQNAQKRGAKKGGK